MGNLDLDACEYGSTVRIQPARCEEILDMGGMFVERMEEFKKAGLITEILS